MLPDSWISRHVLMQMFMKYGSTAEGDHRFGLAEYKADALIACPDMECEKPEPGDRSPLSSSPSDMICNGKASKYWLLPHHCTVGPRLAMLSHVTPSRVVLRSVLRKDHATATDCCTR
jgi:hypothetical protein